MNEEDDECPICHTSMSNNNNILEHGQRTRIHNSHYSHYNCICEWIRINPSNPTCFCRTSISNNICRNYTEKYRFNNMSPEEKERIKRAVDEWFRPRSRPRSRSRSRPRSRSRSRSRSRTRNGRRERHTKKRHTKKRRTRQ